MRLTQVYGTAILDMKDTGWQMPTANPDIARSPTPSAKSSGFHSIALEYPELTPTPLALGFTTEIKSNPEEVIATIVPVAVPDADSDSDCVILEGYGAFM